MPNATKIDPRDLKAVRVKAGFRQRDLAPLAGMTQQRLSDLETGLRQPTRVELARIANVLVRQIGRRGPR